MGYQPTDEQAAIIDGFRTGHNLTIEAGAGAGKTSTLKFIAHDNPSLRGIYFAYNKKIATDAAKDFPQSVKCSTLHSLAYRGIVPSEGGWRQGRMQNGARQSGAVVARILGIRSAIKVGEFLIQPSRLASLAMETVTKYCYSADEQIERRHAAVQTGCETGPERAYLTSELLPLARKAWADLCSPTGQLKYAHDHYLKQWALTHPQLGAHYVLLDEAQDSNGLTVGLVKDQRDAQIITVGDANQSIYGWRGAIDAMAAFGGDRFLLTQSFRFGPAIADEANKWLELLDSDLRLRGLPTIGSRIGIIDAPNAILCRTNAEAVTRVMEAQEKGVKVALLGGGDQMERLARAAQDLKTKGSTWHPELCAFTSWSMLQDYVKNDFGGSDLKVFVDLIDAHGTDAVIQSMTRLTDERSATLTVSTAHKSKGAEWDAVKIASDFKEPQPDESGRSRPSREDCMLNYVAITRAKVALDRGSLTWVDKALANHREGARFHRPAPVAASAPEPSEAVPFGPQDDPDVIARVDLTKLAEVPPVKAGDHLGPLLVVDTDKGLATVLPLDLDRLDTMDARTRAYLTTAAATPVLIAADVPEWEAKGLPGEGWTEDDVATVKAAAKARFEEGLRVALEGTDQEKAAMFGTPIPAVAQRAINAAAVGGLEVAEVLIAPVEAPAPEVFEAPVDPLVAETATPAAKVTCGATHRAWLNTVCKLPPHGPEVLHEDIGVTWDDSKCKFVGRAPVAV